MAFVIGEKVGPYKITDRLGQGGMASVFRAYHASLDRHVAIKVMHMSLGGDESFIERFKREAQIVARLEHPHIVPVYDFAEHMSQPYLVMKYIEGQTLKEKLRKGILNVQEITFIMTSVASALDYAHERDVLHRDVKPSNIVLDKSGVPYLTDFGLARVASSGESTLSQDVMVGTPHYISPEQAQGGIKLDNRTDIYSLAVVLYELVVGRVPFTAETPFTIVHDHIYRPVPPPSVVNSSVTPPVESVLLKALSKERDDRYSTATAMVQDFKVAAESSDITEMSASFLRPDAFDEFAKAGYINVTQSQSAQPSAPPVQPATPPPALPAPGTVPTPTPGQSGSTATQSQMYGSGSVPMMQTPSGMVVPDSSISERYKKKRKRQNRFWLISGLLVFLCGCAFTGLVSLDMADDPNLQSADEVIENPTPALVRADIPGQNGYTDATARVYTRLSEGSISVEEAEALIEEYPNEPAAFLALAMAYLDAGREVEAERTMSGTLLLYDEDVDVELLLMGADLLKQRGYMHQAAFFYLRAFGATQGEDMVVRNEIGQFMYTQALEGNVNFYCEILDESPASNYIRIYLAQALIAADQQEVPDNCGEFSSQEISDLIPENNNRLDAFPEWQLVAANYLEWSGDIVEARNIWARIEESSASEIMPEWVAQEASLKLDMTEGPGPQLFEQLSSEGVTIARAEELVEQYPHDPYVRLALSLAYLESGELNTAEEILVDTLENYEISAQLLMDAAEVLVQRGHSRDALQFYMLAVVLEPQNPEIRNRAGSYIYTQALSSDRNDLQDACKFIEDFLEHPLMIMYVSQTLVYSETGVRTVNVPVECTGGQRNISVEEYLLDVLEWLEAPELHLVLGNYYEAARQIDRAIGEWQPLVDDENVSEWVQSRAEDKLRVNQSQNEITLDMAIEGVTITEAGALVEEYPEDVYAYLLLALAYYESGELQQAEEIITETFERFEPDSEVMLDMADVMVQRGLSEDAMFVYASTVMIDPRNQDIRDTAGAYIYTQATTADRSDVGTFCELVNQFPEDNFWNVFLAQAIISSTPRRLTVPITCGATLRGATVLELLIEVDNTLPEQALVEGNYYEVRDDMDAALEAWQRALDNDPVPWVEDRAEDKIRLNQE